MSTHVTRPAALAERRAQAQATFRRTGLPHRRVEDWKYTDISRAATIEDATADVTAHWRIEEIPDGLEVVDLAKGDLPAWVEHHFGALDNASPLAQASLGFAAAGFALRVPQGVTAGTVRIHVSGSGALRGLLLAEADSVIHVVEIAEGGAVGFRNVGLEILACPDARISHLRLGEHAPGAVTYESVEVLLRDRARYDAHFACFGAKLSRVELHAVLETPAAETAVTGVAVLGGSDHADVTTHIEHAAAGNSRQLFKYVVGGKARAVYQGRITVRKGADGTDSRQTAKAILLDERAEADLKPELLIFADDVKCAHGAAVGDLDDEALYYLESRGLNETEARDLLIRAFLGEAVDEVASDGWREEIWQAVEAALPSAMEKVT